MLNPLDIPGAIVKAVTDLIVIHKVDRWARLVFTLLFSSLTTFLFVCGGALVARRSWAESIGEGMVMAAVMATVLFRRSDLTKGMTVALPEMEAAAEIKTDIQVITKS